MNTDERKTDSYVNSQGKKYQGKSTITCDFCLLNSESLKTECDFCLVWWYQYACDPSTGATEIGRSGGAILAYVWLLRNKRKKKPCGLILHIAIFYRLLFPFIQKTQQIYPSFHYLSTAISLKDHIIIFPRGLCQTPYTYRVAQWSENAVTYEQSAIAFHSAL